MFVRPMLKFTEEQWERLDNAFCLQGSTEICIFLVPTRSMDLASWNDPSGDSIVAMIDQNGPERLFERSAEYHCEDAVRQDRATGNWWGKVLSMSSAS